MQFGYRGFIYLYFLGIRGVRFQLLQDIIVGFLVQLYHISFGRGHQLRSKVSVQLM